MNKDMKNKIISLLLLIPSVLHAEDVQIGDLWYNLIDKAKVAEVTDFDYSAVNIVIPSSVEYNGKQYKVERIREKAFADSNTSHYYHSREIKSVQIPEGVVEICENAFSNYCLESVNIPNSVTTIGASAFSNCRKLSSPIVLSNVERIENNTFGDCSSLTSVKLSEKVKYIGRLAFSYCEKLEKISIPNSVKTIDVDAFNNCYSLKSLHIPSSVTDICLNSFGNAFQNCESLESITVDPNNLVYDSRNNCNAIVDKRLNRIITGCQNTIIPNGIWEIRDNAFRGCKKLKAIDIPSSVYSIGNEAFKNCEELSSVIFHGDLSSLGSSAFYGCKNLKSIDIPFDIHELSTTFCDCINLERVTLPNSVEVLDKAFQNCKNLSDVSFPESLKGFGSSFHNCASIKTIKIPYGSSTEGILNNCEGLETIYLPSSTRDVWDSFQNCKALLDVYCYATEVPYTSSDTFKGSDIKYSTLHVPEESVEKYSTASIWKDFSKIVGFKIQEMSKDEVLSKLDELYNLCQKDLDDIHKAFGENEYKFPYALLEALPSDLQYFKQDIDVFRKEIMNNSYRYDYKPDYYRYAHLEKLWNETYHPQTTTIINNINDILNNLVTLNYKCSSGGKVQVRDSNINYWRGFELSNETKQVQFVSPEYVRRNGCDGVYIYAYPDDGYHVQSIKIGGVEQIGISEYNEEKFYNGVKRYNSLRFSYNDVEVVFASGESSIQPIKAERNNNYIYSINGTKVKENTTSLEGLPKGIYIVNGKKKIIK
jgi:hypothetical protein